MKKRKIDKAYIVFFIIIAVLAVALLVVKFLFHPITVSGPSMEPTYHDGNILTTKVYHEGETELNINDVVVFDYKNDKSLIKRIVGLPGDQIQIKDGTLYRNGMAVTDGFDKMNEPGMAETEFTILPDCVFVLGDNRNNSTDSRKFGMIRTYTILYVITGKLF